MILLIIVFLCLGAVVVHDWTTGYPSHTNDQDEVKLTREVMSLGMYSGENVPPNDGFLGCNTPSAKAAAVVVVLMWIHTVYVLVAACVLDKPVVELVFDVLHGWF